MDYLLNKYLPQIEFSSYEEFRDKLKINVPEDFNFGYDVVDAWAKEEPDKKALVWVNEEDEEHIFTFTEISRRSNQVANLCNSSSQARRHPDPCDPAADQEGYRLPRQCSLRKGYHLCR